MTCTECGTELAGSKRTTCSDNCAKQRKSRLFRARYLADPERFRDLSRQHRELARQQRTWPTCTGCGKQMRYSHTERSRCRECATATRVDPRRRAAQRKLNRAAAGVRSSRVWTQGPCDWCGETFCAVGSGPARWCSPKCDKRAKKSRRQTRQYGGTGWRWSDFMRMARGFNYCCAYCGLKPTRLDPDHVTPLSRGGSDSLSNLLPSCMPCNSDKRDLTLTEWVDDRARRGLAPRVTTWSVNDRRFWHLVSTDSAAA